MHLSRKLDRSPKAPPIYHQIAGHLRDAIEEGEFAEGDRLPSSRLLSMHYGVSLMTVVTALRELEREGLVYGRHGIGRFVRDGATEPKLTEEELQTLTREEALAPERVSTLQQALRQERKRLAELISHFEHTTRVLDIVANCDICPRCQRLAQTMAEGPPP
jgi:DNA-binding GntR family transcriptional regulator